MKNIKLHASPHPAKSAPACPEVWDAEGDLRDLAGRCFSNLRRQNLRRSAELRCRPATGRRRPVVPPAAGQGCPATPPCVSRPALPRPPSCSSPLLLLSQPPIIFVQKLAIKSKQISTYKRCI
jgi:hypothetical protein